MKITVTNSDWTTKKIPITDKTFIRLKTDKKIPTWLKMQRQIAKI